MPLSLTQQALTKLYLACFNRAPDLSGLTFWTKQSDAGKNFGELSETIFSLEGVSAIYPVSQSKSDFIKAIYQNVFGKAPEQEGLVFWTALLSSGITRGDVILSMMAAGFNAPEGTPGKAFLSHRLESATLAAEMQIATGTEIPAERLANIMNLVTAEAASVDAASVKLNQYSGNKIGGTIAVDYIQGATVFADANGNRVRDEGEAHAVSDSSGKFTLIGAKGTVVAAGGTGIATNFPYSAVLTAPAGSSAVTPFTTLQQILVDQGETIAEAQTTVLAAFGLSGKFDVQEYVPLPIALNETASVSERALAVQAHAVAVKIQNLVIAAGNALSTFPGTDVKSTVAFDAVFRSLAGLIRSNANIVIDLTDKSVIESVLSGSFAIGNTEKPPATATSIQSVSTSFSSVLAETAVKIDIAARETAFTLAIAKIAQIQSATQGIISNAIQAAVRLGTLDAIAGTFTGAALDSLIKTAKVVDLDPASRHDDDEIALVNTPPNLTVTEPAVEPPAPDTTAPSVVNMSSITGNGTYRAGDTLQIALKFNEAVTVNTTNGVPSIQLETGVLDKDAQYLSGSGTDTLVFQYIVGAGDTSSALDIVNSTGLALNGGTIRDAAGNNTLLVMANPGVVGTLSANNAVKIDTLAPTVSISSNQTTFKIGEAATITMTFSETPIGFDNDDFSVSGGTLGTVTADPLNDKVYTAIFTPSGNVNSLSGAIAVTDASYTDAAGNTGAASNSISITGDTLAPAVSIATDRSAIYTGQTATMTFTFTETPSGFDDSDITVSGGTLSTVAVDPLNSKVYTATFTPSPNTSVNGAIAVATAAFTDAVGNTSVASDSLAVTVDTRAPTVSVSSDRTTFKIGQTATITFTFIKTPTGFEDGDVTVTGGTLSSVTVDPSNDKVYTATFTPSANVNNLSGAIAVTNASYTDADGHAGAASDALSITGDTLAPTVLSISPGSWSAELYFNLSESVTLKTGAYDGTDFNVYEFNGSTYDRVNSLGTWGMVQGSTDKFYVQHFLGSFTSGTYDAVFSAGVFIDTAGNESSVILIGSPPAPFTAS